MARRRITGETSPLSRDAIVTAALRVLDEEGLGNLTLRRVASELNVQAPAIYWHVKDKTELIDHMAQAILMEQFAEIDPPKKGEPWQDWLVDQMLKLRTAMWSHRDGARVVAGAHLVPAKVLAQLFEVSLSTLHDAGLKLSTADLLVSTAVHFVFGRVIEEQAGPSLDTIESMNIDVLFSEYPTFTRSVKEMLKSPAFEDEFVESIRIMIDGALARHEK
jgi:TetR/AcrR family tetracycline transcriptional repressor